MVKGGHVWRKGGMCGVHPPRDTAGHCAGGTHATGMHSCLVLKTYSTLLFSMITYTFTQWK